MGAWAGAMVANTFYNFVNVYNCPRAANITRGSIYTGNIIYLKYSKTILGVHLNPPNQGNAMGMI